MASTQKDPVLVVLQLTGGNDYLNTVIPYNNPLYQRQPQGGRDTPKARSWLSTRSTVSRNTSLR